MLSHQAIYTYKRSRRGLTLVEMMGSVQDRTREHLGRSDVAIIRNRRLLRKAMAAMARGDTAALPMQNGTTASLVGPLSNDTIADSANWENANREADLARRSSCQWDASVRFLNVLRLAGGASRKERSRRAA